MTIGQLSASGTATNTKSKWLASSGALAIVIAFAAWSLSAHAADNGSNGAIEVITSPALSGSAGQVGQKAPDTNGYVDVIESPNSGNKPASGQSVDVQPLPSTPPVSLIPEPAPAPASLLPPSAPPAPALSAETPQPAPAPAPAPATANGDAGGSSGDLKSLSDRLDAWGPEQPHQVASYAHPQRKAKHSKLTPIIPTSTAPEASPSGDNDDAQAPQTPPPAPAPANSATARTTPAPYSNLTAGPPPATSQPPSAVASSATTPQSQATSDAAPPAPPANSMSAPPPAPPAPAAATAPKDHMAAASPAADASAPQANMPSPNISTSMPPAAPAGTSADAAPSPAAPPIPTPTHRETGGSLWDYAAGVPLWLSRLPADLGLLTVLALCVVFGLIVVGFRRSRETYE